MKILGIDLSTTNCGWAIFDDSNLYDYNSFGFDKNFTVDEKLYKVYSEVKCLIDIHSPDIIAVENSFIGNNKNTGMLLSEIRGVVRVLSYPRLFMAISTATMKSTMGLQKHPSVLDVETKIKKEKDSKLIKKLKNSRREIKKLAIIDIVNKKFNISVENDDQADAISIAYTCSLLDIHVKSK